MRKNAMILAGAVAMGLGIYLLTTIVVPDYFVPEVFVEARIRGAELAKNIVDLSNNSLENLKEIEQYDREFKYTKALNLTSGELLKTGEMRQRAIQLSSQLERMARALSDIKPTEARILATEAVSSEVALVSRLLTYNDYLNQLFETLREKFRRGTVNPNGRVQELVNKINDEVRAINNLNKKFKQSLAEFDKMF